MNGIHWHRAWASAEYWWLVHIIPEPIYSRALSKFTIVKEIAPVILRILIQKVDPDRFSGPAISNEWVWTIGGLSYKYVWYVSSLLCLSLQIHTFWVDKIVLALLDVRINYEHQSSTSLIYLVIHLIDGVVCEVLRIELEVLIALWVVILLGPLDVAPQDVDGKTIVCEVLISFHQHFCRDRIPLTEVETESLQLG